MSETGAGKRTYEGDPSHESVRHDLDPGTLHHCSRPPELISTLKPLFVFISFKH